MGYYNIRCVDNCGIGHSQILELDSSKVLANCMRILFEHIEFPNKIYRIDIMPTFETDESDESDEVDYEVDELLSLSINTYCLEDDETQPNETLVLAEYAEIYAEIVYCNSMDRDRNLREILKKNEILPPDRVNLALKEGYDLEQIAIVAIEEIKTLE